MTSSEPQSWRVTLTPHRSLTREGFLAVMFLIVAVNLIGGVVFLVAGAWPVTGFMGLDVLLIWWAFKANFADARRTERIEITETELILERLADGRDRVERRFVRRWVRVELEEDHGRELIGGLFLLSHGVRTEIGKFLAPFEKKALAVELHRALSRF
ncbi:MAG: DUF2244 domain-containing protein [Rhizobiales bacterium]|nr:DUF2244 domain-containing protein [Hyphomicrobiales bacterium]